VRPHRPHNFLRPQFLYKGCLVPSILAKGGVLLGNLSSSFFEGFFRESLRGALYCKSNKVTSFDTSGIMKLRGSQS
jgi:hypothetical protein